MNPTISSRRAVLRIAWPIVLANSSGPLLGLTDTAVIGNTAAVADLGAIALGSLVFTFVYWSFGFLRMTTTGFVAQAAGSGDEPEVRDTLARSLFVGVVAGAALLLASWPIEFAAFWLLDGSDAVESVARQYVRIRFWSAPAALGTFAVTGAFIGLGRSRLVLATQLFLNGTNIALDVVLVVVFGLGARGVAIGTAISEWVTFLLAVWLAVRLLSSRRSDSQPLVSWSRLFESERFGRMFRANADVMIRTLFLVFGFAWFTDRSARLGDVVLAANHVLLQFVSFSSFFLDGFAHAAEALVGAAVGAGSRARLRATVRASSELAVVTAVGLSIAIGLGGPWLVSALTDEPAVRVVARGEVVTAALYVVLAVAAYQLDGIFIGATRTREMRNAAGVSLGVFLLADWFLASDNRRLWISFIVYAVARAVALGRYYPALVGAVGADEAPKPTR